MRALAVARCSARRIRHPARALSKARARNGLPLRRSLVNWEYKHGPLAGASMDAESKPGRLYVELQRGRNFAPLDTDGTRVCVLPSAKG